MLKDAYNANNV